MRNAESLFGNRAGENSRFTKSVVALIVIVGAQYCLGFITSPLIARGLGPDGRGRFTFFLSLSQWAVVIFGLGAPQAIIYLIASGRFPRSKAFSVVVTVLLTIVAVAGTPILAYFSLGYGVPSPLTAMEAALLVIYAFAALSLAMLSAVLLGLQRTTAYYLAQLLTPLLFFGVLIALLLTGNFDYLPLLQTYTAITILSCIVVLIWVVKQVGSHFNFSLQYWHPILGYGLRIYPGSILSMIIIRMDVFFVTAFLGFTSLGYYAISVQMAEVVYQLACVFATIRLPQTASRSKAEADASFPTVSRQLILLSLLSAALIIAGGITLIRIWLPNFNPSIVALLLLLPGTVSLGMANLYFAELGGRGRAGYGSMIILVNSVTMVLLNLLLIPRWGINGAAISSSIVYTMGFVFALVAVHRESGISFRDLLLVGPRDFLIYKSIALDLRARVQSTDARK